MGSRTTDEHVTTDIEPIVTMTLPGSVADTGSWWRRPLPATMLLLLGVTDALFVALHLMHSYLGAPSADSFALSTDRGHAELFGYLKLLWSGGLLVLLARRLHDRLLLGLAGVVGVLLLDDSLMIHEAVGRSLRPTVAPLASAAVRPQALGELVYVLVVGSLLLLLVLVLVPRSSAAARDVAAGVAIAIGVVAVGGVLIDVAHVGEAWRPLKTVAEDGTELVALSGLLTWLAAAYADGAAPRSFGQGRREP